MHAWYRVTEQGSARGVTLEARDEGHAQLLGTAHGYKPADLVVERLPPSKKRPLKRRFAECPHCQFLRESGLDTLSEAQKARLGTQGK